MYALYSALLGFFLLLTLPYWLLQMMRHGKYRAGLRQRFGAVPPTLAGHGEKPAIWVHHLSPGEPVDSNAALRRRAAAAKQTQSWGGSGLGWARWWLRARWSGCYEKNSRPTAY